MKASSYLLDHEGLAALKLEQDTVIITLSSPLIRLELYAEPLG